MCGGRACAGGGPFPPPRDRWDLNPRPSGLSTLWVPEPDVLSWLSSRGFIAVARDLDYGPVSGLLGGNDKKLTIEPENVRSHEKLA